MAKNDRVAYLPDESLPELGRAVSGGLAVLRTAGVTSWAELNNVIPARVALHPGQLDLLRRHAADLHYIRVKGTDAQGRSIDMVTMAICPVCGMWELTGGSSAPSRCQLTQGCDGAPVRVPVAPRSSIPALEDGRVSTQPVLA